MSREWFTDDAMWTELFDFMFPPESFDAAEPQVERLVELFGRSSGRVLDLACGPGRHAIPLARRGFTVTGVDRTQALLDHARSYAASEKVEVEWVRSDMREFVRPDAFDLVLNAFTSFGYFREWDDNVLVLRNVFASLASGGTFVLEILGKEGLAVRFRGGSVTELGDGRIRIEHPRIVDNWRRIVTEWIYIDGDELTARYKIDHWLYSAGELIDLFTGVGFQEVSCHSGWKDAPYGPGSMRLLVMGRKP